MQGEGVPEALSVIIPPPMGECLAVVNQKGGVGKTTTAVNLAVALAWAGRRVLLVDADPQGNATTALGQEKPQDGGTAAALLGMSPGDAVGVPAGAEGLTLWTGHARLRDIERDLARAEDGRSLLGERLREASWDFCVIDCPPSLGALTESALKAADGVLVPLQAEFLAMEGLAQVSATLERVRRDLNPALSLRGVLMTMLDPAASMAAEIEREVRTHFADAVLTTAVPRDPLLAEAPSHGLSILEFAPDSRGAYAYVMLARELLRTARPSTAPLAQAQA